MPETPDIPESRLPEPALYDEVVAQITKDFAAHGVPVHFPELAETDPREVLNCALLPVIDDLVRSDRNTLMKIIYRVDIPEVRLGTAISGLAAPEASREITRLIVLREWQKVDSRRRFG